MVCSAVIDEVDGSICCSRGNCGKLYHPTCVGIKFLVEVDVDLWICPECRCAIKKGGDNSFTPVGSKQNPNVTLRKKTLTATPTMSANSVVRDVDLSFEMQALRSEMSTLKDLLTKALSLMSSHEEKITKYALLVDQLNGRLEKYEKEDVQLSNISCAQSKPKPPPCLSDVVVKQTRKQQPSKQYAQVVSRIRESSQNYEQTNTDIVTAEKQTPNDSGHLVTQESKLAAEVTNYDGKWTTVKKRSSRPPIKPLHGTADPVSVNLKAIEIRKYFHLWNMASGVDEVRQYVTSLCPEASCSVEELTARGDYKSYKIGVAATFYDELYSADVWPINARFKPWINYRKVGPNSKTNDVTISSAHMPFRKPASTQQQ